jgi:hypothetical protein
LAPHPRPQNRACSCGKNRMQLLEGDIGQHLVKEPTEPNGTPRYSCDIANLL